MPTSYPLRAQAIRSRGQNPRTYAFAARTGRLPVSALDPAYLARCETEIRIAGTNAVRWSQAMAYGSSFPLENKGIRAAGWYFSSE